LKAFGTGWSKTWDANALIIRYLASRNQDALLPFGGDMKGGAGADPGEDAAADQPSREVKSANGI